VQQLTIRTSAFWEKAGLGRDHYTLESLAASNSSFDVDKYLVTIKLDQH